MIIPIRCMTCGKILADKWNKYVSIINKNRDSNYRVKILDISLDNVPQTPEAKALDELNIKRYCCRRHMLTSVNLIDII